MAKNTRVFRVSKDSAAALVLDENQIVMAATQKNFVGINPNGIAIKGPVSFIADTLSRRHAGLFVGIFDLLEMIPQTIMTPFPSRVPMPPMNMGLQVAAIVGGFSAALV